MKLVLVSTHVFGQRAFEGLVSTPEYLGGRIEVPLVIGGNLANAHHTVGYSDIANFARENDLPYLESTDSRLLQLAPQIREVSPDLLVVVGWSSLIPQCVLDEAHGVEVCGMRFRGVGMHPTKLPGGRGQAPIPWSIIRRLDESALSVFYLTPEADAGPTILQLPATLRKNENAASLFYRMSAMHFEAGQLLAPQLISETPACSFQDDRAATRWPKRRPSDGELNSSMSTIEVEALVRALMGPYPRAHIRTNDGLVYVSGSSMIRTSNHVLPFKCKNAEIFLKPALGRTRGD